eukprot:59694_1
MTAPGASDTILDVDWSCPSTDSEPRLDEDTNVKCCRICYESSAAKTMIAPCLCSGDLKLVHRKCLNEYRALYGIGTQFTQCTTCNFEYILEPDQDHVCCGSPQFVFRMRVARDVIAMILAFLSIVSLMAWMFTFTEYIQQNYPITENDAWNVWKGGYIFALAAFFMVAGVVGIVHGCYFACAADDSSPYSDRNYNRDYGTNDGCDGCFYVGHVGSPDCDCGGGGDGDNDGLVTVLAVLAVVLIVIGTIYALIVSCILISRMSAKHYAKLNAQLMTREYVVKDLKKYSKKAIVKMQRDQQEMKERENPLPSAPQEGHDANEDGPPNTTAG